MADSFSSTRTFNLLMQSTTASMNIVNPLSHRLKTWHESLPPTLSLNSIDEGLLNANGLLLRFLKLTLGCLHLAFYTIKISLHRAIMRSIKESDPSNPISQASRADARRTASSVIQFTKQLTTEHMQAFWYSCTLASSPS